MNNQAKPILVQEGRASLLRISLEIAIERFRANAVECRAIPGHHRLAEQFDKQAREAEELLNSFCEGDSLRIEVLP